MRTLCLVLVLSACSPRSTAPLYPPVGQQIIASEGTASGIQTFTTPEHEIFRDGTGLMVARPTIVQRGNLRRYAVLTNVRRRDVNGPVIEVMASGRQRLDYDIHDRLFTHCIDGCQRAEIGAITLTEAQFRQAARVGLPVVADGRRQSYAGQVPAAPFARVLVAADAQRAPDPPPLPAREDMVLHLVEP